MTVLGDRPLTMGSEAAARLVPQPRTAQRRPTPRRYLMCRPEHFSVSYAINPWMDVTIPVDVGLALAQWESLRATYLDLGHVVETVEPVPGLPDMVFAANGAVVAGGRALGARFTHPERRREATAFRRRLTALGVPVTPARFRNEGEGDFLVVGDLLLAGTGFRTDVRAHHEAQELLGLPVVSLSLVDPRFYHLDTAIGVLDESTIAYLPAAFSPASQAVLATLFPDAVRCDRADAEVLGLNVVSDGRHVVMPAAATGLALDLAGRGFEPVPVDLSELLKAGGSVKCTTMELRAAGI